MYLRIPHIIRLIAPNLVWTIDEPNAVFITFDDGPTPRVTEYILDTLHSFGAKATFFCLGKNVELYPELFDRIMAEGHRAGNHTYNHLKGYKVSNFRYLRDIETANRFIHSDLFRPPYGRLGIGQFQRLKKSYRIVLWNIISQDYGKFVTPEDCYQKVADHIKPGSIICFHDSVKTFHNMSYALPRILELCRERGWECKAIP